MFYALGVARFENIKIHEKFQKLRKYKFLPSVKKAEKFYVLNETTKNLEEKELNKIVAKTLVINGGIKDIVPLEEAKYLNENIAESKLVIFEKDNHTSYTRKKYFYEEVNNFLENLT